MNDKPSAATSTPGPRPRLDRRALLRAGAGAAPVLLTLASNPVAAANSCVVASSFVSVTTFKSRNPTTTVINCTTRKVEDWRTACTATPRPTCVEPFVSSTFGTTTSGYNGKRLYEVLGDTAGVSTSGELGVLQHLISLRLCVTQGFMRLPAGNVSTAYLDSIWQNYKTNGNSYKLPASGINWTSTQLIGWLRYQLNYSVRV